MLQAFDDLPIEENNGPTRQGQPSIGGLITFL